MDINRLSRYNIQALQSFISKSNINGLSGLLHLYLCSRASSSSKLTPNFISLLHHDPLTCGLIQGKIWNISSSIEVITIETKAT